MRDVEASEQLPISGPIGRFGDSAIEWIWSISSFLALLNPFQLSQICRQIAGNNRLEKRERRTGDDGSEYRSSVVYSLPFQGEWYVFNGGLTPETSHSWDVLGQRFAMDFVKIDDEQRRHTGRGTRLQDYYCYEEDIAAAADGRVVAVEDRIRAAPLVGWGVCDFMARSFIGNYVLIRHAKGEYGLYAHLIRKSVSVAPGDDVVRGQTIGRCGHTGHSSEPHLHFHLQDSADLFEGMGRPVRFDSLIVDGEAAEDVHVSVGSRVQSARSSP